MTLHYEVTIKAHDDDGKPVELNREQRFEAACMGAARLGADDLAFRLEGVSKPALELVKSWCDHYTAKLGLAWGNELLRRAAGPERKLRPFVNSLHPKVEVATAVRGPDGKLVQVIKTYRGVLEE